MKIKTFGKILHETSIKIATVSGGNVIVITTPAVSRFNLDERKWFKVRLKVVNSRGKFSRIGYSGKRVAACCWHGYGYFLNEIFKLDKEAVVYSSGRRFTADNWEWIDWNIGSILSPFYYSQACDCE